MAYDAHLNFAYSTIAVAPAPAASGTSLTVAAGQGALFPATPFNATVWPISTQPLTTNAEIVRVTAVVGDVLTITRTQEGTSARTIIIGDQIAATITVKTLTDVEVAVAPGSISAGGASASLGQVIFSNNNGVSFGLAGQTVTATVVTTYQPAGAYLTTAMASNRGSDFVQATAVFAGTNASGTIASGGLSISVGALAGQSNQTVGLYASSNTYLTSSGTVDARSLTFRGDKSITIGISGSEVLFSVGAYLTTAMQSNSSSVFARTGFTTTTIAGAVVAGTHDTDGLKLAVPAYLTTAMASNAATLSNINISAGTTSTNASAFTFSNANNVSFGLGTGANAGVVTATITVPAQSNQTLGLYAVSNTEGASSSSTFDARTVSFQGKGAVSVGFSNGSVVIDAPSAGAGNVTFSAGAGSSGLASVIFSDSNGVSFGLGAGSVITASVAAAVVVTLSAGTASQTFGNVVFSNSNRVSFGLNGSTVTAQHALNFSAGTTSQNISDQVVFSNSNGYTFGLNASTITVQGPVIGYLEPRPLTNTAGFLPTAGSWYFASFVAPGSMSGGRLNLLQIDTVTGNLFRDITESAYVCSSTGAQQQSYTFSKVAALYSQGTGTNSTRLESFWSNSFSWGWSKGITVCSSNVSQFSFSVQHSLSYISAIGSNGAYTLTLFNSSSTSAVANSTTNSNIFDTVAASIRNLISTGHVVPIGFNTTISAGNYWLAYAWSTTRANASTGTRIGTAQDYSISSDVGISRIVLDSTFRNWGSTASTARSGLMPYGVYTGGANMAPPANVALNSDLSSLASAWVPYFNFQMQDIT